MQLDKQVGGDHYKHMVIQPITYIMENNLGYCEGNVIKYISRWRAKNGIEDLFKARHYIDILIEEFERGKQYVIPEKDHCSLSCDEHEETDEATAISYPPKFELATDIIPVLFDTECNKMTMRGNKDEWDYDTVEANLRISVESKETILQYTEMGFSLYTLTVHSPGGSEAYCIAVQSHIDLGDLVDVITRWNYKLLGNQYIEIEVGYSDDMQFIGFAVIDLAVAGQNEWGLEQWLLTPLPDKFKLEVPTEGCVGGPLEGKLLRLVPERTLTTGLSSLTAKQVGSTILNSEQHDIENCSMYNVLFDLYTGKETERCEVILIFSKDLQVDISMRELLEHNFAKLRVILAVGQCTLDKDAWNAVDAVYYISQ